MGTPPVETEMQEMTVGGQPVSRTRSNSYDEYLMETKKKRFSEALGEPLLNGDEDDEMHCVQVDAPENGSPCLSPTSSESSLIVFPKQFVEAPGARRPKQSWRHRFKQVHYIVPLQIGLLILLVVDIGITLTLVSIDETENLAKVLRYISLMDCSIFFVEMVVVTIIAQGVFNLFLRVTTPLKKRLGHTVTMGSVSASLIVELAFLPNGSKIVQTVFRILRFAVVFIAKINVGAKIGEKTVSSARRRYIAGGYDLDLTYITDKIIAMSWPSKGSEALYRNKMEEVALFLDKKHPDRYKVYNLCAEREYETDAFHNRVERIAIDDHQPCDLIMIHEFCESADAWLEEDPRNVIIVHCKGGKGRTGMMTCSHLFWAAEEPSVRKARERFGNMRTEVGAHKVQTVESPSQNLYLSYFEACCTPHKKRAKRKFTMPAPIQLYLSEAIIGPLPHMYLNTVHKFVGAVVAGSSGVLLWSSESEAQSPPLSVRRSLTSSLRLPGIGQKPMPDTFTNYRVLISDLAAGSERRELSPEEYYHICEDLGANVKTRYKVWLRFDLTDCPPVEGDIRLHVMEQGMQWSESIVWTWFHTSFVDAQQGIVLERPNVDGAHKDNENLKYTKEFKMVINFQT
ncbi:Phosphatidylinositol 3 [Diplonema papillatum]|nr:Phosphatidylinositol 3 [Diplonema papillatum]